MDGENQPESGGEFRQKFEQTQAEAAGLRQLVAEQFGVSADDLKGVPVDQIPVKAAEIQQAKQAQEEQILRAALEKRGLAGDDLEAALAKLAGGSGESAPAGEQKPAPTPFVSTGSAGGAPPGKGPDLPVRGADRILAALQGSK